MKKIKAGINKLIKDIENLDLEKKIDVINDLKTELHKISPFKSNPVDCVIWVKSEKLIANDYNPNTVAPPEMKLLALSIESDGYTQPVVSWKNGEVLEVVDGFHRTRCGKEYKLIADRIHGYLPTVIINSERSSREDRMASTIRHNRARGKHGIDSMSEIVVELKKRNRDDAWIANHLGMDKDEVLRLTQISGLTELFSNKEFSSAWDTVGDASDLDINLLGEEGYEETN